MSRLTEKNTDSLEYRADMSDMYGTKGIVLYEKLSKLENIEDELGIDLITLSKALVEGIYTKRFGYYNGSLLSYQKDCFVVGADYNTYAYYFKDYGKTWALTKEELEKC